MEAFAVKVQNFARVNLKAEFGGALEFLNIRTYRLGEGVFEGFLTATGSATEFTLGVNFWNQYGRLLYNAAAGQPYYNASSGKQILRRVPSVLNE